MKTLYTFYCNTCKKRISDIGKAKDGNDINLALYKRFYRNLPFISKLAVYLFWTKNELYPNGLHFCSPKCIDKFVKTHNLKKRVEVVK